MTSLEAFLVIVAALAVFLVVLRVKGLFASGAVRQSETPCGECGRSTVWERISEESGDMLRVAQTCMACGQKSEVVLCRQRVSVKARE